MRVCVGGTFHPFHQGHQTLLKKACDVAGSAGTVFIGITTGKILKEKKVSASFKKRKKTIEHFLIQEKIKNKVVFLPIKDKYGPTLQGDFDAIVVSTETYQTAREINMRRKKKGKPPLQIIKIPLVRGEDRLPIRSSRIRAGEIDTDGHRVKKILP